MKAAPNAIGDVNGDNNPDIYVVGAGTGNVTASTRLTGTVLAQAVSVELRRFLPPHQQDPR